MAKKSKNLINETAQETHIENELQVPDTSESEESKELLVMEEPETISEPVNELEKSSFEQNQTNIIEETNTMPSPAEMHAYLTELRIKVNKETATPEEVEIHDRLSHMLQR